MSQTTYSIPNLSIYVPQPHKGSSRFFSSLSSCHNHFLVSALRWSFPVCGAFWWRTSRRQRTNVEWKDVAGLAVGAFPFPSSFCFWHAFCVSRTLCDLYMDRREAEKDSSVHCTYLSVNHASRSSNVMPRRFTHVGGINRAVPAGGFRGRSTNPSGHEPDTARLSRLPLWWFRGLESQSHID